MVENVVVGKPRPNGKPDFKYEGSILVTRTLKTLITLSNNLHLKAQFSQGWERAANPVLARSSQYAPQSWQQIMPSEHFLTLRYFNSHFPCKASVLGTCSRVKKCCLAEPTLHLPGRALGWLRCGVGECKFLSTKAWGTSLTALTGLVTSSFAELQYRHGQIASGC